MYLTFGDYQGYGGTLEENEFRQYEFEAGSAINYYTFNRLSSLEFSTQPESTREAVQRCEFALIQLYVQKAEYLNLGADADEGSTNVGIASESNDGVSVSYNVLSANQAIQAIDADVSKIVNRYLQGCVNSLGYNLLYRGLYPNE